MKRWIRFHRPATGAFGIAFGMDGGWVLLFVRQRTPLRMWAIELHEVVTK